MRHQRQRLTGAAESNLCNPPSSVALRLVFCFPPYSAIVEHGFEDEIMDGEDMEDPVVLRGLLQCIAIAFYVSVRYVLDVLFTPRAVQAVSGQFLAFTYRIWRALWCAPVLSCVLLHYWGSIEYGFFNLFARWLLRFCVLRSLFVKLMDDEMVLGHIKNATFGSRCCIS